MPQLAEVERLRAALHAGGGPDPRARWLLPRIAEAVAASFRALDLGR